MRGSDESFDATLSRLAAAANGGKCDAAAIREAMLRHIIASAPSRPPPSSTSLNDAEASAAADAAAAAGAADAAARGKPIMCIVRGAPRAALSGPGERHRSPVRAGVRTLLRRREREKAQLALLQRKSTSPRKTLQPQPQTTLPPSVPTPSPPLRPAAAPPLGAAAAAGDESVRGISSLMRHARSRTRNILAAQDRQPVLSADAIR